MASAELTSLESIQAVPTVETPTYEEQVNVDTRHIPLLWKDAPINPFRFNPKLEKEQQGRAAFVTLKAKFLPGLDVFGFVALTALPKDSAPRFLKASKIDKATVQLAAKKSKPRVQQPSKKAKPRVQLAVQKDNLGGSNPKPQPILKKKPPLVESE